MKSRCRCTVEVQWLLSCEWSLWGAGRSLCSRSAPQPACTVSLPQGTNQDLQVWEGWPSPSFPVHCWCRGWGSTTNTQPKPILTRVRESKGAEAEEPQLQDPRCNHLSAGSIHFPGFIQPHPSPAHLTFDLLHILAQLPSFTVPP